MKRFEVSVIILLCLCFLFPACGSAESKGRVVVLDTDIGTDDAFAFMVAALSDDVHIDYIVASSGNGTLDDVTRNALTMKKYWGLDSTVVRSGPCEDMPVSESKPFHGFDGLAGISRKLGDLLEMSPEEFNDLMSYDDFKAELRQADAITYINIGPVTTLSELIDDAGIRTRIDRIILMGGGIRKFNREHDAEFNFSRDPESTKKIMESGLDITLIPLDLTYLQTIGEEQITELEETGKYEVYISLLKSNRGSNIDFNNIDVAVLHDTMPIFYLAKPEAFNVSDLMLIVDEYGATRISDKGNSIHVALSAEDGLLSDFLMDTFTNGKRDGFTASEDR